MPTPPNKDFFGKPLSLAENAFPYLPDGIGDLIMGELDPLEEKVKKKTSRAWIWMALSGIVGLLIGGIIGVVLTGGVIVTAILASIVASAGVALAFRYTRAELRYRFVGTEGAAEVRYISNSKKYDAKRSFLFGPGMHLYTSEKEGEQKYVGNVKEFDFRWRANQTNVFRIKDKFMTEHATAKADAGYPWALAAEKSWTDWLKAQTPALQAAGQGVEFVVLGGLVLYLFPDRIRIERAGEEPDLFGPDTVKRVQLTPEVIRLMHLPEPIEFPLEKFSDRAYFKWLVKEWYAWETVKAKN